MKRVYSFIHSRVARRIFALFIMCALLPVCVLALVSMRSILGKLERDSHERLRQTAKNAGMTVLEGLTLVQEALETMPVPAAGAFRTLSPGNNQRFRAITVVRNNADRDAAMPIPSLPPGGRAHLAAGNALILAGSASGTGGPVYMFTSKNRGLPRDSFLVGEINLDYIWTLVGYTLPPGVDLCTLDPLGNILYSSRPLSPMLVSRVMSAKKLISTGQFEWRGGREVFQVNYWSTFMKPAFLSDSWTVVAIETGKDALGPARSFIITFVLIVFLTIFVVTLISSVLVRRSLVPLSILKDGASRLSRGDFDARVEIGSGDEFEELAVSFNDMSQQLGVQFARQKNMGLLVQSVLEAHDRETVTAAVMSHFRASVPCEWLAISMADGNGSLRVMTRYNRGRDGALDDGRRFETTLSQEEFASLNGAEEYLRVWPGQGFPALLAPMAAEGAREFYLLPIFIKDRFLGILILGYGDVSDAVREELPYARHVANEIAISLDNVRLIDELHWLNRGTIEALANAVDAKSPWTAGHSERVTKLSLRIGREMKLSLRELEMLELGGLFHDMGKLGVPGSILDKKDCLTEEEFAIIRTHPEKGAEILGPIRAYQEAIPIVAQHHEKFDGSGYPLGLAGEEIALGARILAVADVFDALYSSRPYRGGWELERVIAFLKENAGSDFDPQVVNALMGVDKSFYRRAVST